MANLTGQQINNTYQSLLKTDDNGAIGGTAKAITDGAGNATNIEMSNTATNFVSGTVDFTGSTVSGLPAGSDTTYDLASAQSGTDVDVTLTGSDATTDTVKIVAGTNVTLTDDGSNNITIDAAGGGGGAGLVSGTATDSMESASTLTTVAANAQGNSDIVLGAEAESKVDATYGKNVVIGFNASHTGGEYSTIMGRNATSGKGSAVVLGNDATNSSGSGIVIGSGASTGSLDEALAIGIDASCTANAGGIAFGRQANSQGNSTLAAGRGSLAKGTGSVALGWNSKAQPSGAGDESISIGFDAQGNNNGSVAIGLSARGNADGAVALGGGVTAAKADTVSVKALETQTDSTPSAGGIIMSDAGSTYRRVNIDTNGTMQVDSARVGVGYATPKVSENQAASSCDTTRASVLIPANTVKAGDILQLKSLENRTGSSGFTYSNIAIHTSGTIGQSQAGAFISGFQSGSDGYGAHSKNIFVQTVDGTGDGSIYLEDNYTPQEKDGSIFSSNLGTFTAIDWTVDQYLCVNVCIDNSGATWTNYGASLQIIGRA